MITHIIEDGTPVKFYPYTHGVADEILSFSAGFSGDEEERGKKERLYRNLEEELIKIFKKAGIRCALDNKIVFEIEYKGIHFFIGFYDWRCSIGLRVYGDSIPR